MLDDFSVHIFTPGSRATRRISTGDLNLIHIWWFEIEKNNAVLYGLTTTGIVAPISRTFGKSDGCERHLQYHGSNSYEIDRQSTVNLDYTVKNNFKHTTIGRTVRNNDNILLLNNKWMNNLGELSYSMTLETTLNTKLNTKTMFYIFLDDADAGCLGQSIEILVNVNCPEQYLFFDYHKTLNPIMSHYWKKLYTNYEDWAVNAQQWGRGVNYLINLNKEYETKQADDPQLQYPIFLQIPKNYRPPSR